MLCIIFVMHIVAIWNLRDDLERTYTLNPSTEVLFIGSSQVGCSIDEDEENRYHLQKLWVSDTITPSFLMRLKELDRRGQLANIKMIAVPFNINSIRAQAARNYLWAWYQELPIAWRYMELLPYSHLRLIQYILCNLRYPFYMHFSENTPERDGLAARPESYRKQMIEMFVRLARNVKPQGTSPDWEEHLLEAYREMNLIAMRHGIRFIVFKAPLLPQYELNLSDDVMYKVSMFEQKLKSVGIEYVAPNIALDSQYFFDDAHLIKSGAKIFTEVLFSTIYAHE